MRGLILAAFFLHTITFCFSQRFNGGLTAGLSTSQVSGDDNAGFHKIGFAGGGLINYSISSNWSLQLELLFMQKGSRQTPDAITGQAAFTIDLAYAEIPLFARYRHKKFLFDLGLYFGRVIWNIQKIYEIEGTVMDGISNWDFGINAGINYYLWKGLGVNFRFSNSLIPIKEKPAIRGVIFTGGAYNTVLAFSLFYQFKAPPGPITNNTKKTNEE